MPTLCGLLTAQMDVPVKLRDIQTNHFDSTRWDNFPVRNGDIIIATAYKSGTTWTQHIVSYLLDQGMGIVRYFEIEFNLCNLRKY